MPTPATADQAAMACGRSFGGKTAFRMDSVAGMTNAAPRPITTRAPISVPVPEANAAAVLPQREHGEPAEQREPAPVPVTERPGRDQQRREAQRVGVA